MMLFASWGMSGGFEREDNPESVVDVEPLRMCPEGTRLPVSFPDPGLGGGAQGDSLSTRRPKAGARGIL